MSARHVLLATARQCVCLVMVFVMLQCLLTYGYCGEEATSAKVAAIQAQLAAVNRQIDDAQRELSRTPGPNYCCCAAAFVFAPVIGGIFWYFVDIKPKQDKRSQLERRIETLTSERRELLTQLALLQK